MYDKNSFPQLYSGTFPELSKLEFPELTNYESPELIKPEFPTFEEDTEDNSTLDEIITDE